MQNRYRYPKKMNPISNQPRQHLFGPIATYQILQVLGYWFGKSYNQETRQYLVWDKDGEEDTVDEVATSLFEAAEDNSGDQDSRGRSKAKGKEKDKRKSRKSKDQKKKRKKDKKKQKKRSSSSSEVSSVSSCPTSSSEKSSSSSSSDEDSVVLGVKRLPNFKQTSKHYDRGFCDDLFSFER